MSFMYLEGEELIYIWESIRRVQIVFHPRYSCTGEVDYKELQKVKCRKKVCVLLDRNLLSSLLKLSRYGHLKNEKEMRLIALLMTWSLMNDFPVSAGLAIKEKATNLQDLLNAKIELQEFNNIFSYYPSMVWLRLAEGEIDTIPQCPIDKNPFDTNLDYTELDDHFLMHISEMLHIVYLNKQYELSPVEKMLKFLDWNYKNLLLCETTLVYVAMLFTNQFGIKAPKFSGSNDINKVYEGCKNQAWDLTYLSSWSCFHYDEDKMDTIFLFATNDYLLKRIFINTYAEGGVNALLHTVFNQIDYDRIIDFMIGHQGANRKKPSFGENPQEYFKQLIDNERQQMQDILN